MDKFKTSNEKENDVHARGGNNTRIQMLFLQQNIQSKQPSVQERKTQFICGICDKKYEGKRALTVHIRTIHEGKKLFKFDICDKKYSTEKHLKRHIATIHTDENQ